ncbi:MAG: chromosomal replication initiator protein [Solirubrobacterales bacterium]|nr:chromosomal replication initiator protein [Solirubrobacterales bacterium]
MPAKPPEDDLAKLWQGVRGELEASLPAATFSLWFQPLRAVSVHGTTLFLTGPPAVRAWVERRYAGRLLEILSSRAPELTEISFLEAPAGPSAPTPGHSAQPESLPVRPGHNFSQFVIGPGNRLAHAAALAVAESPGEAYNPLFLHGPPGLGKTHLLGAIVEYLERVHPELEIHYTTAERFTSEFVAALRRDGPEAFKARYRELDALLIDDVQVLEGKHQTELEFVHTFNTLHAAGKQIVLSSDRPPEALSKLADRLRDRFDWGLRVELEPPDLRTRMAVLWQIASDAHPELPDPKALQEIASSVPNNLRLLEGAMTRVMALGSLLSEPITPPLVRRALGRGDGAPVPTAEPPTLSAIQDAVCAVTGVTREELLSSRRTPRVAHARQLAMYLARELTPLTLAEIARSFDRDHTTVLHAIRTVADRVEPGSETAVAIHSVHSTLGTRPVREDPSTATGHDPPSPGS